jgi:peptidoglycan/xylan/chitin deacetylase (PgdA/CDA1 family)
MGGFDGKASHRVRALGLFLPLALALTNLAAVEVAASEVPEVSIAAPASVHGTVDLTAVTSEGVTQVEFSWAKGDGEWIPLGIDITPEDGWTARWETDPYSGPARLRADASDGVLSAKDVVATTVDNAAPVVRVHVSREVFSPGRDGHKDSTIVTLNSNEPGRLSLALVGLSGRVRREWTSQGDSRLTVHWRGLTEKGTRLWDGKYFFKGSATDRSGFTRHAGAAVTIDTRAPEVSWNGAGGQLFDGLHKMSFGFDLNDHSGRAKVRLDLWDHTGWVDRTRWNGTPAGSNSISWRPAYQRIQRPLSPGRYKVRVTAVDRAGNIQTSRKRNVRVLRSVRASVYSRIEGAGSRVALTFDDCLYEDAWSKILSVLRKNHVKATFFCPGQYVYIHPEMARRTVRDGHSVGSHAWDHALLGGRAASETTWRLRRDEHAWWDVAHDVAAPFFRPPYGSSDSAVVAGAGAASYQRVVLWDVDTNDWRGRSPGEISATVVHESRPGSIVLMHVLPNTAAALPSMLRGLEARGLKPVSLHRLFAAGGLR